MTKTLPFANKQLGQHWLSDKTTLEYIVSFAHVTKKDTVLEIGPGPGTLTEFLSRAAAKVVAVEYDQDLALRLAARFSATNVTLIPDDIMQFDLNQMPENYKVVANIPYYLTSNLLRRLLESDNPPSQMTLLVQKEVAERIAAKPGDLSVLGISVQFYCQVESGEVIRADMFTPPPKVDSQVIKLKFRQKPLFDVDKERFFKLVKAGFREKRKKLPNSLAGGLSLTKEQTVKILIKSGIDPEVRAQQLSLEDWHKIYKNLY